MQTQLHWLVENPFRMNVVIYRLPLEVADLDTHLPATPGTQLFSTDALWRQLVEAAPDQVWTGSLSEGIPLQRSSWPELVPDRPKSNWQLHAIQKQHGQSSRSSTLLRSGLLLINGFLDESHAASQSMEGDQDADLWHAIMHRREPDFGNAKYWYRRVGNHPIFEELAAQAAPILNQAGVTGFSPSRWNAAQFVDLCELVTHEDSPSYRAARQVQWLEMCLHLAHCVQGR